MPPSLDLYDYDLPPSLIAQTPLETRHDSRLMVLRRGRPGCAHRRFTGLPGILPPGALLVVNNTRVAPRRLRGTLATGVPVEALLLGSPQEGVWEAMVKKGRRVKPGLPIHFAGGALPARAVNRTPEGHWMLRFEQPETLTERLERHGLAPLPPYIRRNGSPPQQDARDREAYQTCYARVEGAVAAPTAGLHFTPQVLAELDAAGVERAEITLHVGLGTFAPIKVTNFEHHKMEREWYEIPPGAAQAIRAAREQGRPVIAVGTTTVRTLESWALAGFPARASGWSELFIHPPFTFRAVDGLITNFHQPRSTLLLLVAALHGRENLFAAYGEAIRERYRFFSFGDCMVILPEK